MTSELSNTLDWEELREYANTIVIEKPEQLTSSKRAIYSQRQTLVFLQLDHLPVSTPYSDLSYAHQIYEIFSTKILYCPALGGWLSYTGSQWVSGSLAEKMVSSTISDLQIVMRHKFHLLKRLVKILEGNQRTHDAEQMLEVAWQHDRQIAKLESDSKRRAVLNAAKSLFSVDADKFEDRSGIVGFQDGVWDHGTFRDHKYDDYLLNLSPVAYRSPYKGEDFKRFIDIITNCDPLLQKSLQDFCGYCVLGLGSKRILVYFAGKSGTGKSTIIELLLTFLGNMATTLDPKHLRTDASRERLGAAIIYKRLIIVSEIGTKGQDLEILKTLTGGDSMPARKLFQESFTFSPRHVILQSTNDMPYFSTTDNALKNRIRVYNFNYPIDNGQGGRLFGGRDIEGERKDVNSDFVKSSVRWFLEGAARVLQTGDIYISESIKSSTEAFLRKSDPLLEFFLDLSVKFFERDIPTAVLRGAYETWAKREGETILSNRDFAKCCRAVGLISRRTNTTRLWHLADPSQYPRDISDISDIKLQ